MADPDGGLTPDIRARLPGRGVWLLCRREVVEQAAGKNVFARALRRRIRVPPDLANRVEALLVRRCLERLGLARRAGELVTGFAKVETALAAGRAALWVEASDGAEDGRRKLFAAARRGQARVRVTAPFKIEELSLATGGQNVVHAAMYPGRHASGFDADVRRLAGFRAVVPPDWTLPDWLESVGGP